VSHGLILLGALVADWRFGEPERLWGRIGHPVAWMGWLIARLDEQLNHASDSDSLRYRKGALAWAAMVAAALAAAWAAGAVLAALGPLGWFGEGFVVFALIAQKSLRDHVAAVASGLRAGGIEGGRAAVAQIVGRDPARLDQAGVSRAAIESLAENFSDGVVAPAFWYLVFGLPGIVAYKMINTADSMIGHRSERYLFFGRVTAQADDFANWLPARLSALIVALAALLLDGAAAGRAAASTVWRDAGLHRSPNAGWPEAAFAGALGIALGGSRVYATETVSQAWLNGAGRIGLDASDIDRALKLFAWSCFVLWALAALSALLAWAG